MKLDFSFVRGSWRSQVDGLDMVIDRRHEMMAHQGVVSLDVMIVRFVYGRRPDGTVNMHQLPHMYIVEPIQPHFIVVEHKGFVQAGGGCSTTASVKVDGDWVLLTPGRFMQPYGMYIANHTSLGFYDNHAENLIEPREPQFPGRVVVDVNRLRTHGSVRVEGLYDTANLRAVVDQRPDYLAWLTAHEDFCRRRDALCERNRLARCK